MADPSRLPNAARVRFVRLPVHSRVPISSALFVAASLAERLTASQTGSDWYVNSEATYA
jgi:hypothetical protein